MENISLGIILMKCVYRKINPSLSYVVKDIIYNLEDNLVVMYVQKMVYVKEDIYQFTL